MRGITVERKWVLCRVLSTSILRPYIFVGLGNLCRKYFNLLINLLISIWIWDLPTLWLRSSTLRIYFNEMLFHVANIYWGSVQLVKNLLATWETWVWSLGWEDPLEKETVFWPGEFHVLYSPLGRKESDKPEWLSLSIYVSCTVLGFWNISGNKTKLPALMELSL